MSALAQAAGALVTAFIAAFVVEGGIEYILGTPMAKIQKLAPFTWVLMYFGLAAGLGVCWYYQLDLIAVAQRVAADLAAQEVTGQVTPLGVLLTGVVVGRGSNYLHQFVSKFLPVPK